ncbi:MAG: NAD(P)-binding domain-containing protein [Candidatus Odinarchaeia archaeon]
MRIQIIGAGTVGKATGEGFFRFGHKVVFCDVNKEKLQQFKREGFEVSEKPVSKGDVHFVCTPEGVVEKVVDELSTFDGLIVIRSSVLPGTTKRLAEKHGRHISHNPEFLRAAMASWDVLNPDRIVIGECCENHGDVLEKLYKPLRAPIVRVDPTTSEMIKLASNAALSAYISFWNEIHKICGIIGVNSHVVGKISSMDRRISEYGASMHGKAFGGACLPKDLDHLTEFSEEKGYTPELLKAIKNLNKRMTT